MFDHKLFRIGYGLILILVILFLLGQVEYIIDPILSVVSLLIVPILIGAFLYYLLRPMVRFLTKYIRYKNLSILITFLVIIGLIVLIIYFGGSIIQTQTHDLIKNYSNYYELARNTINNTFQDNDRISMYLTEFKIQQRLTSLVENIFSTIKNNISGFFSTVTNIGTKLILIPFVLFYLLKDDQLLYQKGVNLIPTGRKEKAVRLLKNIDYTLSRYISGQLIVALILGLLTYIGYLVIGLQNSLILALIATITSFIPFIGAILGIIPAIFIALGTDLLLVLKVLIVMIIVQQLEGNLISPKIQGNRMEIHPLIVIFIVLTFIIVFGYLGALFAVPTYAVVRVILGDLYRNRILKDE